MNILDIFFPRRCVSCGTLGKYICDRCRWTIHLIGKHEAICPVCEKQAIDGYTHPRCKSRYAPDGLTSFFRYDGVVKKAIKSIKYRFVSDVASEFVSLIPELSIRFLPSPLNLFMIPIPLHVSKLRFRGFNQAEKLGRILAERLHIPIQTDILLRTRETEPQVAMRHRTDRLLNMDGVFAMQRTRNPDPNGENDTQTAVILFDDVFTTGATMRSATNALKRAGVKRVWAVTIAR